MIFHINITKQSLLAPTVNGTKIKNQRAPRDAIPINEFGRGARRIGGDMNDIHNRPIGQRIDWLFDLAHTRQIRRQMKHIFGRGRQQKGPQRGFPG